MCMCAGVRLYVRACMRACVCAFLLLGERRSTLRWSLVTGISSTWSIKEHSELVQDPFHHRLRSRGHRTNAFTFVSDDHAVDHDPGVISGFALDSDFYLGIHPNTEKLSQRNLYFYNVNARTAAISLLCYILAHALDHDPSPAHDSDSGPILNSTLL
ncbi:hypothetical protein EVAR_82672_1 [Eumeta japonica]|uniref:Uncharacterized protein n=1 Tax=Eumeta variegata TaxID=151549 RepID=A0A4C1V9W2_EUMVA|nr:hypothetical protein EVAR_82672_1 [Eumeta japonica]